MEGLPKAQMRVRTPLNGDGTVEAVYWTEGQEADALVVVQLDELGGNYLGGRIFQVGQLQPA